MVNEQHITPLAKRFGGYEPPAAIPVFDEILKRQGKQLKRKYILFLSIPVVLGLVGLIFHYSTSSITSSSDELILNTTATGAKPGSMESGSIPTPSLKPNVQTLASTEPSSTGHIKQTSYSPTPSEIRTPDITRNPFSHSMFSIAPIHLLSLSKNNTIQLEETPSIPIPFKSPITVTKRPFVCLNTGVNVANTRLKMGVDALQYIHPDFERIYNATQENQVSWIISSAIHKPIIGNLWFGAGLGIVSNKISGYYRYTLDSVPVYDLDNTIGGFVVYPDTSRFRNVDLGSAKRTYSFVQLPLSLSYIHYTPKFAVHLGAGAELSYLIQSKGVVIDAFNLKQTLALQDVIHPMYASFQTNIAVFRKVSPVMELGLGMRYTQQLNTLYGSDHYSVVNRTIDVQFISKFNLIR